MKLEIEITESTYKKLKTIREKAYFTLPGIDPPTDSEIISDLINEGHQHCKELKPMPTLEELLGRSL